MKISVILAHPNKGSFNYAIAATAVKSMRDAGHYVRIHDLYEEQFAPCSRGRRFHSERLWIRSWKVIARKLLMPMESS